MVYSYFILKYYPLYLSGYICKLMVFCGCLSFKLSFTSTYPDCLKGEVGAAATCLGVSSNMCWCGGGSEGRCATGIHTSMVGILE